MIIIKFLLYSCCVFIVLYIIDLITSFDLLNRYKMYGYFGRPGSGKSTFLTKIAYKHVKKGWEVYTNNDSVNISDVKFFNENDLKSGKWLPDGRKGHINENGKINEKNRDIVLLIDEIGTLYNNRNFKDNFTDETLQWWKRHRHRNVKIYYFDQQYNGIDLKLRDSLTDEYYLVKRGLFKNFCVAKPILIDIDIQNDETTGTGGKIVDKYKYDFFIFHQRLLLRKWIHKFDSYN